MRNRKKCKSVIVNCDGECEIVELKKWLLANGWKANLKLRLSIFPLIGRGIQCMNNVMENSVLISIPRHLLITRTLAESVLGKRKSFCNQEVISIFLILEKRQGTKSFWWPYIRTLPKTYTVPFFACKNEIACFPDYLKHLCIEQRQLIAKKFKDVSNHYEELKISSREFSWAWFTVNTRAVYFEGELALAPLLDMFNHCPQAETVAGNNMTGTDEQCYQIVSKTSFKKQEQVFINYGPHDNLKLYLEYGFVLPENPHDFVPIDVDVLIRATGIQIGAEDKITLERSLGKMNISSMGPSWSALGALYAMQQSPTKLDDWTEKLLFNIDLESSVSSRLTDKLLEFMYKSLMDSITALSNINSGGLSESGQIGVTLLKYHLDILETAMGDKDNTLLQS